MEAIAREVQTYKTRLRPLIREANLYHILPRPDDRHWDGIQYYNPAPWQGATYVYKPHSENEAQTIRLKGLEGDRTYRLAFEDGSNPATTHTGAELMDSGFNMRLLGTTVSELVWIERV